MARLCLLMQDGGVTWLRETLPLIAPPLRAVQCISDDPFSAVAVGNGSLIVKTENNGINWEQLVQLPLLLLPSSDAFGT